MSPSPQADRPRVWEDMMTAAQDGDRRVYADLLKALLPVLRRIVIARMGSAESEDVVQDILISLHTSRHSYLRERPFLPWLMAIARHGIADHMQRRGRARRLEKAFGEISEEASPARFDRQLEARDFVNKGLASLPASQRMALELMKIRQLSLDEASRNSGMSIGTLKVAVHRGLRALQQNWATKETVAT